MHWRLIPKPSPSPSPPGSGYRSWKPLLAEEAQAQCVYCCIHESRFGGFRNFHVEHYRPKSRRPDLELSYENLFYACGICNSFKGDDWPSDLESGDLSQAGYPDPSLVDYSDFLLVDLTTGEVSSPHETGRYIIERLHLNRAQILVLRRILTQISRIDSLVAHIKSRFEADLIPDDFKDEILRLLLDFSGLQARIAAARPYLPNDLR